jgi:hypothetical protein
MQDMKTKFSKAIGTFLIASAEFTRPTFARFLADRPLPEPVIPAGRVLCQSCDGSGTWTHGFRDGVPLEDRCLACNGFGHVAPSCPHCRDTGKIILTEWIDEDGEALHSYCYCGCSAGFRLHEVEAIDDEKVEHEASLPDYDAMAYAAVAAGHEPY